MISRPLVKYVLAAAGVIGLCLGAWAALWVTTVVFEEAGRWVLWPAAALGGAIGGIALMLPLDRRLGAAAAHVDLLRVPVYWARAAAVLFAAQLLLERFAARGVPPFVSTLALWGAAVWSMWRDERAAP